MEDDKVAASEKPKAKFHSQMRACLVANSITSDLRLAEDLATANFRHMQDKVHTDLANLDAYYMEKQEVANRAVTWQNMSLIVALMLYVFFVFQQLS